MSRETDLNHMAGTVGFWVYGPADLFPEGNKKNLPKEIESLGYVRMGVSTGMTRIPYSLKSDILLTIGNRDFLGKRVRVMDYINLGFETLLHMDGILLCEYTSRKGLNPQSCKTESNEQLPLLRKDGEHTAIKDITDLSV